MKSHYSNRALRPGGICLDPDQWETLERLSQALDRPKSWVLRKAFAEYTKTPLVRELLDGLAQELGASS